MNEVEFLRLAIVIQSWTLAMNLVSIGFVVWSIHSVLRMRKAFKKLMETE